MTIAEMVLNPASLMGHDDIDRQHLELVRLYNQGWISWHRYGRLEDGYLEYLTNFAIEHFATEEEYMRELAYPGISEQRDEHDRLLTTLHHMRENRASTLEIVTFLGNWLEYHTHHVDARFVEFVRERART